MSFDYNCEAESDVPITLGSLLFFELLLFTNYLPIDYSV